MKSPQIHWGHVAVNAAGHLSLRGYDCLQDGSDGLTSSHLFIKDALPFVHVNPSLSYNYINPPILLRLPVSLYSCVYSLLELFVSSTLLSRLAAHLVSVYLPPSAPPTPTPRPHTGSHWTSLGQYLGRHRSSNAHYDDTYSLPSRSHLGWLIHQDRRHSIGRA